MTAAAVRGWLLQRGLLPQLPLFAGVPVSARAAGDTDHSIQVAFISVNLHTGAGDPLARLMAIHHSASAAKDTAGSFKALIPDDVPSIGLPWLLGGLARLVSHPDIADRVPLPFNVIVSNVPGPPMPLYMAGAKLQSHYPASVIMDGVALNITVLSYLDRLDIGIVGDRELAPNFNLLVEAMRAELAELLRRAPGA
jgi:hypothetical protein